MKLPENVYVITDCSESYKSSSDFAIQVILHKELVWNGGPWVKLYYGRDSDYEIVQFTHKFGTCLTIIYDYDHVPSVGDVIIPGNIHDKFGTYWHHGAFDKEIENILEQYTLHEG